MLKDNVSNDSIDNQEIPDDLKPYFSATTWGEAKKEIKQIRGALRKFQKQINEHKKLK
jgi:hypothetical protein